MLTPFALAYLLAAQGSLSGCHRGPPPKPPETSVLRAVCGSELGGEGAHVRVWRGRDDAIVTLELLPDVSKVSDAPSVFFDPTTGRETERIRSLAVAPSSPEALDADRRREMATVDGKKAETLDCPAR